MNEIKKEINNNESLELIKKKPELKPLKRLYKVGKLMDNQFDVPILGRVGIDPLVGLIPVLGDTLGYLISVYIIVEAGRLGIPFPKIIQMSGNALIDALTGYVPIAGDLLDVKYKANARNVNIILDHYGAVIDDDGEFKQLPVKKFGLSTKGKVILWIGIVLVLLILAGLIALPFLIGYWLFSGA